MEAIYAVIEAEPADMVVSALCALLASQIKMIVKDDIKAQDKYVEDYASYIKKTLIYNREDHLA